MPPTWASSRGSAQPASDGEHGFAIERSAGREQRLIGAWVINPDESRAGAPSLLELLEAQIFPVAEGFALWVRVRRGTRPRGRPGPVRSRLADGLVAVARWRDHGSRRVQALRVGTFQWGPHKSLKRRVQDEVINQRLRPAHFRAPEVPVGVNEPRPILRPNVARRSDPPFASVDQFLDLANRATKATDRFFPHSNGKQPEASDALSSRRCR